MMTVAKNRPLGKAVYDILRESQKESRESRSKARYPFFRPVSIRINGENYPAFSREFSEAGIGLLHSVKLKLGEVKVTIPTEQGYSVSIRTRIIWCRQCGEGWFISGGEFVGISGIDG
jgi:PilZ domain